MKKYTILGITVAVLAILLLSFAGNQESKAGDGLAFSGTVEGTRTVVAKKGSTYYYADVDSVDNYYLLWIPDWDTGWYCVTDGCQHFNRYWDGMMGQFVNFNVPQNGPCN